MVVLDVPTPDHIPSIVEQFGGESYFSRFRESGKDGEYRTHLVVHLCGEGVLEDVRYKAFMNSFPEGTQVGLVLLLQSRFKNSHLPSQHLFSSRKNTADPLTFVTAGRNTLRVNQLDANIFPLPHYDLETPVSFSGVLIISPTHTR